MAYHLPILGHFLGPVAQAAMDAILKDLVVKRLVNTLLLSFFLSLTNQSWGTFVSAVLLRNGWKGLLSFLWNKKPSYLNERKILIFR